MATAVDEVRHAELALALLRHFPASQCRRLGDRERRLVLASHHVHHRQRRAIHATTAAAGLDVGAALGGPELAVEGEEAGRLETRGRGEDVEPEGRLDHELLRVGAAQDHRDGVWARVEHVPHPVGGDGEEVLPGAVPAAEEEGGDDEEAGHRFALCVAPLGGRAEVLAYPLVGFIRVGGRFVV